MYLTPEDFGSESFDALTAVRRWRRRANYAEIEKAVTEVESTCRSEIASDNVTEFAQLIFERIQKVESTRPQLFAVEGDDGVAGIYGEMRKLMDERRELAREKTMLEFVEMQLRRLRQASENGEEIMSIRRSLEKFPWCQESAAMDEALKAAREAGRRRADEIFGRSNFLDFFRELEILGFHVQAVELYLSKSEIYTKNFTDFRDFVSVAFTVKKRLCVNSISIRDAINARIFQRLERLFSGRLYPDPTALEAFQNDFSLCEQLFDRDPLFLDKFHSSAYVVFVAKSLESADLVTALLRLWRDHFLEYLYPEIFRKSLDLISRCSVLGDLEVLLTRQAEVCAEISDRTRPELRAEVAELLSRVLARAEAAVDRKLETESGELVTKVVAQLEGVKQVPMLYRLTSKNFPTRCSAYVEAANKALRAGLGPGVSARLKNKVKAEILANFRRMVDDIKTTDDKTNAQLSLDWDEVVNILKQLLD